MLPSKDLKELSDWKDEVSGRAKEKIEEFSFDVVIIGASMSGCGAALAARSQRLKVALIQDRPLFGGNASEEVRVHSLVIHGYGTKILKKIDTAHHPNGHAKAKNDHEMRKQAMAQSGLDLFAYHLACGLEKEGNQIVSVEAREVNSGRIKRFSAPSFIDATGDGWLGYWAGADYRYGREAASEHNEGWDKYGDLWSPEKTRQSGNGDKRTLEQCAFQDQTGFSQGSLGFTRGRKSLPTYHQRQTKVCLVVFSQRVPTQYGILK